MLLGKECVSEIMQRVVKFAKRKNIEVELYCCGEELDFWRSARQGVHQTTTLPKP